MRRGVLTIGYGTVDDLDDLPEFLQAIRRGRPAPAPMVAEVRRRYMAIGGRSPLNDICHELTRRVGDRLGLPAVFSGRMWRPTPDEALGALASVGVDEVVVLPLAPYSSAEYVETVRRAAERRVEAGHPVAKVTGPAGWSDEPRLIEAFATSLSRAIADIGAQDRAATRVVMTAHSLPDPAGAAARGYDRDVRATAEAVARAAGVQMPRHDVCFQSQGMAGGAWLGPTAKDTLDRLAREGVRHVVFAPIGFLADHAEVLYDLDIEARGWTLERGMTYARCASLNASAGLVDALEAVAKRFLS